MIDSGSSRSFLDPQIAFKLFPNSINYDPFVVSTVFQESSHEYSVNIPIPKIFRVKGQMKLFLFKFHEFFDGLIGMDNMKSLKINLDYNNGFLITPTANIRLKFHKVGSEIHTISISPRVEQVVKIRTSLRDGEIIIPYQKLNKCEIPESLSVAKDGEALTTILNNSDEEVTLDFSEPFVVEKFDSSLVDKISFNNIQHSDKFQYSKPSLDLSKIRIEHLNSEEKQQIIKLCSEFSDVFYNENDQLTFTNQVKHQIRTSDEIPVYAKTYRYPFIHKKEVDSQIQKMLDQKIIRPSCSPWSAPIWVVPKKLDASGNTKWRVVVDYRRLNEKTIDDKYPLPNITDLLDKLGKCQYFTTLDLASGFHQIEMHEKDIEKTAFSTEHGHYEFLRMPFGLKNAPATFQRVMDNVLRGLQNEKVLVYLDDILIYSTSLQEHIEKLRLVFQRLRDTKFKIQLDKSEFLRKEVAYLGHVVTPNGVKPNPDKVIAIKNYPLPKTTKEIKGFLGLLGYYRRFINNFAKITKPMTKCLKKGAKIEHNEEFLNCFEKCKNLLINEPILQYPDFSKTFNLTTDASNFALGAVLSQGPIGQDLPVAYASRTLNDCEKNLSVIEKELLGIVWATKYFRPYLFGRKFNIICDHKPLKWLWSLKEPNSKLFRWRLKLEEFNYDIIYKKGKLNTNADALSRIEIHTKETFWDQLDDILGEASQYQNVHFDPPQQSLNTPNFTTEEVSTNIQASSPIQTPPPIQLEPEKVPATSEITQSPQVNQSSQISQSPQNFLDNMSTQVEPDPEILDNANNIDEDDGGTIHTNAEQNPIVDIPISESPLNYGPNQIIFSLVLHSPAKPKLTILFEKKQRFFVQISKDNFDHDIVNFIKEYVVPKTPYYLFFEHPDMYEPFCEVVRKNFKWPSLKFKRCKIKLLDVCNKNDIQEIIQKYHESKTNHRGIDETEQRIKNIYYWPNLKKSVQTYINECEICHQSKYERNPVKTKLNTTPTALRPFEILHLDTFTLENCKFLTIIDSFSKYAQAYKIDSLAATDIVNKLIIYFSHHGIPKQVIVDNGTEFKNSVVNELLKLHKISIHFCSPNHPQSNGLIERLHSTLIEHVRLLNTRGFTKTPIDHKIHYALLAYNHTIHSSTKFKPIDIINGHISNDNPFDINIDEILINDYINDHKDRTKILYSKLNENLIRTKDITNHRENKNRDDTSMFQPEQNVYVKKHIRQKTANKYGKQTKIQNVNTEQKTISTADQNKIHMDNLKRPRKKTYSFSN